VAQELRAKVANLETQEASMDAPGLLVPQDAVEAIAELGGMEVTAEAEELAGMVGQEPLAWEHASTS
jgi:hypothetical protein